MTPANVWLAQDSSHPEILVIGVPWATDSGADLAPLAVRDRLHRFSTAADEWGVDLSGVRVRDEGNWAVSGLGEAEMVEAVAALVGGLADSELRIYLGGDAAISPLLGSERLSFDRDIDPLSTVHNALSGPGLIHVHVDLGVLDRVWAPGAPQARPGGLYFQPLSAAVRTAAGHSSVVGFDLTGVDPDLDRDGLTLDAMAHLFLSAVAGYAERA